MDRLVERVTRSLLSWFGRGKPSPPKPPQDDQDCPPELRKAIWDEVVCARKGLPLVSPVPDPLPKGMRLVIRGEIYRQLGLTLPDPEATLAPVPQRVLNLISKTISTYMDEPMSPDSPPGDHSLPPVQPA